MLTSQVFVALSFATLRLCVRGFVLSYDRYNSEDFSRKGAKHAKFVIGLKASVARRIVC